MFLYLPTSSPLLTSIISFFSYFTYLTYIGLCAYYCASGTQTIVYAIQWRKLGAGVGYPLQRWPRVLQAMHVVLQATVFTFGKYYFSCYVQKRLTVYFCC